MKKIYEIATSLFIALITLTNLVLISLSFFLVLSIFFFTKDLSKLLINF